MKTRIFFAGLLLGSIVVKGQPRVSAPKVQPQVSRPKVQPGDAAEMPYAGYLFAYFTGNERSEEGIRFAISGDGYHFRALNKNEPIVESGRISQSGGVRDPNIIRGKDGKSFFMVATDMVSAKGWNSNRAMVLMRSVDLIHWTSAVVNIQTRYSGQEKLERVWAPQTIYDDSAQKYMVYFSLKYSGEPDKICYAYANGDFTDLEGEVRQLFFKPDGGACIDADIARANGRYYLFFKTEDSGRPGIKIAVSDHLTHGYKMQSEEYVEQTPNPVEGAGTFRLNDGSGYILMYDVYTSGAYQFTKTRDFESFVALDSVVDMNFHPRHGTIMSITEDEGRRLASRWLLIDPSLLTPGNEAIVGKDVIGDEAVWRVRSGTDRRHFDPGFVGYPGVSVTPAGAQDFSGGGVKYTVSVGGRRRRYRVVIR